MKTHNTSKGILKKAISDFAVKTAVKSTNSTCLWFQYQPKQPCELKNFKK